MQEEGLQQNAFSALGKSVDPEGLCKLVCRHRGCYVLSLAEVQLRLSHTVKSMRRRFTLVRRCGCSLNHTVYVLEITIKDFENPKHTSISTSYSDVCFCLYI